MTMFIGNFYSIFWVGVAFPINEGNGFLFVS
jgi:hypothetical protein